MRTTRRAHIPRVKIVLLLALAAGSSSCNGPGSGTSDVHVPTNLRARDVLVVEQTESAIQAVRDRPDDVDAWMHLAMVYHANAMLESAAACYEDVLARRQDARAAYLLADVHRQHSDVAAERAALEQSLEFDPDQSLAHWRLGDLALDAHRLDEAERAYWSANEKAEQAYERAVAKAEPAKRHRVELDLGGWIGLVRVHLARRQPDQAEAIIRQRLLDARYNRDYARELLATAHRLRGDTLRASIEMARARGGMPVQQDHWLYDVHELKTGAATERERAESLVAAAIRPDRSIDKETFDRAIAKFETLRTRFPDDVNVLVGLAVAWGEIGAYDRVRAIFEKAAKLDPMNPTVEGNLAQLDIRQWNDNARALERIDGVLAVHPCLATGHGLKGQILLSIGREDEGIEQLRQAVRCNTKFTNALQMIANAETRRNRPVEAMQAYEEWLAIDPSSFEAVFGTARLAIMTRDFDRAENALVHAEILVEDLAQNAPQRAQLAAEERLLLQLQQQLSGDADS